MLNRLLCLLFGHQYQRTESSDWRWENGYCKRCGALYRWPSVLWLLCQHAEEMSDAMHEIVCQIIEQLDKEMVDRMGKDELH